MVRQLRELGSLGQANVQCSVGRIGLGNTAIQSTHQGVAQLLDQRPLDNARFSVPVLVRDMYERAYGMDYGAARAKYVDAFMATSIWTR